MKVNSVPLNDLGRADSSESIQLIQEFSKVLSSGNFINGPQVRALESRIGDLYGVRSSLAVASGSDALYLALRGLKIGSGQCVVTVGNAAGYSTNAILRCGARPLLVDVDPLTAQMSPSSLDAALRLHQDIRGVIVTHLYGLIGQIDEIADLCEHHGVFLIEDCAQSFGAVYENVLAGAWGDATAFSFYPTKNLAALGDGGMVGFKDPEACARARKIAQYGWSSRYEVAHPDGINSRLDEIQAAVLLHRLGSVHSRNSRRRDILRRYAKSVTAPRRLIFEDSERCVAHLAVMRTPTRDRDQAVLNEHGIDTAIHFPIPDHLQPAWRHLFEGVIMPDTETHCREALTLPCFPELTEEEIERVCEALGNL